MTAARRPRIVSSGTASVAVPEHVRTSFHTRC